MAILKNVECWWVKCDPKRPSKNDPENPAWEVQIRTKDKAVKKEWEGIGIHVKAFREDKDDEESKVLYYKASLRRKTTNKEGKPLEAPEVVNGKREPVDPNTVGNGSVCNIRVFPYEYSFKKEGKLVEGKTVQLQALQVIVHKVYTGKPMEEFDEADTETILPEEKAAGAGDEGDY